MVFKYLKFYTVLLSIFWTLMLCPLKSLANSSPIQDCETNYGKAMTSCDQDLQKNIKKKCAKAINNPILTTIGTSNPPMLSIAQENALSDAEITAEQLGKCRKNLNYLKDECRQAMEDCRTACEEKLDKEEDDRQKQELEARISECEEAGTFFLEGIGDMLNSTLDTALKVASLGLMLNNLLGNKGSNNTFDCEKLGLVRKNGECVKPGPEAKTDDPNNLELGNIKKGGDPIVPGGGGGKKNNNQNQANSMNTGDTSQGKRPPAISFPNASDTSNNDGSQNSQVGSVGQIASSGSGGGGDFQDDNLEDESDNELEKENKYKSSKMEFGSGGGGGGRSYASTTKRGRKNILSKMGIKVKENSKKKDTLKRLSKLDASDNIFARITNRFHYACQTKIDCK